ncbi:unnamed protein product [Calypogeia fissa]
MATGQPGERSPNSIYSLRQNQIQTLPHALQSTAPPQAGQLSAADLTPKFCTGHGREDTESLVIGGKLSGNAYKSWPDFLVILRKRFGSGKDLKLERFQVREAPKSDCHHHRLLPGARWIEDSRAFFSL